MYNRKINYPIIIATHLDAILFFGCQGDTVLTLVLSKKEAGQCYFSEYCAKTNNAYKCTSVKND